MATSRDDVTGVAAAAAAAAAWQVLNKLRIPTAANLLCHLSATHNTWSVVIPMSPFTKLQVP